MSNFFKNYWAVLIPVIVLGIALYFLFRKAAEPASTALLGMVDAEFTDVAAEFPGRLDTLLVNAGDTVKKGQLLGVVRTKEINAINNQALAAIEAAQSNLSLLQKGPRPELVASSNNVYKIAQDQYSLAKTTYERIQNLYNKEVVSGEERDIIQFKMQAAEKEMEIARLNWEMLQKGTQPEMIAAANAILKQAEQAYELTKSISENTRITAPNDGIISTLIVKEGEIISIGYPIMTIQEQGTYFVRFNVRQDDMKGLSEGAKVTLDIPGCTPQRMTGTVSKINATLTFANWVPTRDRGQFELRTFTVECKPENADQIRGLRSGMTAELIR